MRQGSAKSLSLVDSLSRSRKKCRELCRPVDTHLFSRYRAVQRLLVRGVCVLRRVSMGALLRKMRGGGGESIRCVAFDFSPSRVPSRILIR